MDMSDVEHLNNDELIAAIINDIRSAAEDDLAGSPTSVRSVLLSDDRDANTTDSQSQSTDSENSITSLSENVTPSSKNTCFQITAL